MSLGSLLTPMVVNTDVQYIINHTANDADSSESISVAALPLICPVMYEMYLVGATPHNDPETIYLGVK